MTTTEAAKVRYDEAQQVASAYQTQVTRARQAWASAPTPDIAARQQRRLAAAIIQHKEAQEQEQAAFSAWHQLHTAARRG